MTYDEKRNQRCRQAQEQIVEMKNNYGIETEQSIRDSEIIKFEGTVFSPLKNRSKIVDVIFPFFKTIPKIIIEEIDSVNSVINHTTSDKVAVLNFASFKNPGGGFINGSHAQEECLCYASNLYNILSTFRDSYYLPNREDTNDGLYYSKGIYSPNVIFKQENKVVRCDVITIACPNRGSHLINHNGTEDRNTTALVERIGFVLETAAKHNVKTLILGAYGCGVFKQDPKVVAKIFKKYLQNYNYGFDKVIFAIPGFDKRKGNLKAFKEIYK